MRRMHHSMQTQKSTPAYGSCIGKTQKDLPREEEEEEEEEEDGPRLGLVSGEGGKPRPGD